MSDREDEDYDDSEDGDELAGEPVAPAPAAETEAPSQGFYRRIGEYTSLAFVMPAAMLVGFFGGRWIGSWLGGPGIGSGIGLVLGTGAAFLSLYHSLRRLERGG
jgi:Putative F0F1-ATPase subunit Ca2+/Mg2+ transporter